MAQRIYTKTGDQGETGLFGGGRVSKSHPRVRAYGAVDELNAVLGWSGTQQNDDSVRQRLQTLQPDLFAIGAHLATVVPPGRKTPELPPLPVERIAEMEHWIDAMEDALPPLRAFILPGGSAAGAALHVARTVCRRAEREVVELTAHDPVDGSIIVYLNRLSDLLFDLARLANHGAGAADIQWQP